MGTSAAFVGVGCRSTRSKAQHPHGKVLSEDIATGVLPTVSYRGGRIRLVHNEIGEAIKKNSVDASHRRNIRWLIGMRDSRSENSWMHNSPRY